MTLDRMRLLAFGRQWLYDRKLLMMREKDLRAIISGAIRQFEAKFVKQIRADAGPALVERWQQAIPPIVLLPDGSVFELYDRFNYLRG